MEVCGLPDGDGVWPVSADATNAAAVRKIFFAAGLRAGDHPFCCTSHAADEATAHGAYALYGSEAARVSLQQFWPGL